MPLFRVTHGPMPLHPLGWAHAGEVVDLPEATLTPYWVQRYGEIVPVEIASEAPAPEALHGPDPEDLADDETDVDAEAGATEEDPDMATEPGAKTIDSPANKMAKGGRKK